TGAVSLLGVGAAETLQDEARRGNEGARAEAKQQASHAPESPARELAAVVLARLPIRTDIQPHNVLTGFARRCKAVRRRSTLSFNVAPRFNVQIEHRNNPHAARRCDLARTPSNTAHCRRVISRAEQRASTSSLI